MNATILDASALLALLREEAGYKIVETCLDKAIISSVNYSEVIAQLVKYGMPPNLALSSVKGLGLNIVPFDEEMAYRTAALIEMTAKAGLSLGDRACLALAQSRNLQAITADKNWIKLNLDIKIKLIR